MSDYKDGLGKKKDALKREHQKLMEKEHEVKEKKRKIKEQINKINAELKEFKENGGEIPFGGDPISNIKAWYGQPNLEDVNIDSWMKIASVYEEKMANNISDISEEEWYAIEHFLKDYDRQKKLAETKIELRIQKRGSYISQIEIDLIKRYL